MRERTITGNKVPPADEMDGRDHDETMSLQLCFFLAATCESVFVLRKQPYFKDGKVPRETQAMPVNLLFNCSSSSHIGFNLLIFMSHLKNPFIKLVVLMPCITVAVILCIERHFVPVPPFLLIYLLYFNQLYY